MLRMLRGCRMARMAAMMNVSSVSLKAEEAFFRAKRALKTQGQ